MNKGDQVVCIKDVITTKGNIEVQKGTIHIVYGLFTCGCGNVGLDLGMQSSRASWTKCRCGKRYMFTSLIMPKEHFRPVDWKDCREELIQEVMMPKVEIEPTKIPEKA